MDEPRVLDEKTLASGAFLSLKSLLWRDGHGAEREWESAVRENFSGAVLIIPLLRPSNRIAVIRQYRPPARKYVLEFPAGLVNPGETPEAAAIRELREETGFVAKNIRLYPSAYTTPGMTDESVYPVVVEIDETLPENQTPRTEFDPSEMIETLCVSVPDLPRFYRDQTEAGAAFDAKLAGFIIGLNFLRQSI